MPTFNPGLVHAPVTPFTTSNRIDFDRLAKLIAFHVAHGADAIAVPMHVGEGVSLRDEEKRELLSFVVKTAGQTASRKTPMIAHVSDSGTAISASLAAFAEKSGAAAIVATTPYYWTPPPPMLLEHFAAIAAAVKIPMYVHNAPDDMSGVKVSAELLCKLIDRAPNFAGAIDSTLDWQFMIELMTDAPPKRPTFQLLSGIEYMVSAGAIGATGLISSLAAVAPQRVRKLHDLCRADKLVEARSVQEDLAALRQVLKSSGVAGLKAALRIMGRDCGEPREPLQALSGAEAKALAAKLEAALVGEPRGW